MLSFNHRRCAPSFGVQRHFLFFLLFLFLPFGVPRYPPTPPSKATSRNIIHVIKPIGSLPPRKNSDSIITKSIKMPPVSSPDNSPASRLKRAAKNPPRKALIYNAALPNIPVSADGSAREKHTQPKSSSNTAPERIDTSTPFILFLKKSARKKIHPFIKTSFVKCL